MTDTDHPLAAIFDGYYSMPAEVRYSIGLELRAWDLRTIIELIAPDPRHHYVPGRTCHLLGIPITDDPAVPFGTIVAVDRLSRTVAVWPILDWVGPMHRPNRQDKRLADEIAARRRRLYGEACRLAGGRRPGRFVRVPTTIPTTQEPR